MYDQHIILDFEMNPVLKKYAEVRKHLHREIIEIGATKVSPDGRVLDTFSCFVKPKFSSDVAEYITKLTGIKTTDIYIMPFLFLKQSRAFRNGLDTERQEFIVGVIVTLSS